MEPTESEGKRARASLYFRAARGDSEATTAQNAEDDDAPLHASLSEFISRKRRRDAAPNGERTTATERTERLTEMEKQVVALKAKNPDVLLLFECGYRMRMFGDDAENAARVLGIRVQRHRAFMEASVPVHRALHHGRRLVLAGFKIGIVKQLSSVAATTRQPLERDVVEVYTRATIPDALDGDFSADAVEDDISGDSSSEQVRSGLLDGDQDAPNAQTTDNTANTTQGQTRFILAVVEETAQNKRLFTKLVHAMKADLRAATDFENVRIGVFGYDIHSGESVFDEFTDDGERSKLLECLSIIQPVEFLLPNGGVSPQTEQVLEDYSRREGSQIAGIGNTCPLLRIEHVEFVDTFMISASSIQASQWGDSERPTIPRLAHCCLCAMASYLRSLRFDITLSIDTIRVSQDNSRIRHSTNRMKLTPCAQKDLALVDDRPGRAFGGGDGSLFSMMNHTRTPFGARLLKEWLQSPLTSASEIEERQGCVEFLSCVSGDGAVIYETLRDDILPSSAPSERLLQQLHLRRATPSSVVRLLRSLIQVEKHISLAVDMTISKSVVHKLLHLHPRSLPQLETALRSFDIAAAEKNDTEQAISKMWARYSCERREVEDIEERLRAVEKGFRETLLSYRRELNMPALDYCSHRANGFGKTSDHLIAVDRDTVNYVPGDWLVVSSTKAVVRFYAPQVRALQLQEDLLLEKKAHIVGNVWLKIVAAIDSEIYVKGIRSVDVLAQLDCLASMATIVRLSPNYVKPIIATTSKLTISGGRHPTLELLTSEGSSYISGDIELKSETTCGTAMVISGPNMGGKSTMLRMVALLIVMAQMGSFVPARSMTLSTFDAIHSRMHRSPDLKTTGSYGAGHDEMQQLSALTKTATARSLVLLDEVGFGLTTQQANALAVHVVKYLVKKLCCRVLLATHTFNIVQRLIDEGLSHHQVQAKELAHEVSNIQARDSMTKQSIAVVYHYTTRDGVATRSLALQTASQSGLSKHIIERAATKRPAV